MIIFNKYICFLAILYSALMPQHGISKDISADQFYYPPKEYQFTMSPSGKSIAFVEDKPQAYFLNILDLDSLEIIHRTPLYNFYPSNLVWLNERRVMYEQGGRLIAMNIDGTEHRVILDNIEEQPKRYMSRSWFMKYFRRWEVLDTLPDSYDSILTMSTDSKGIAYVNKVNIFTGDSEVIASGKKNDISRWQVNRKGDVILGINYHKGNTNFYIKDYSSLKSDASFELSGTVDKFDDYKHTLSGRSFIFANMYILGGGYDNDTIYVSERLNSNFLQLSEYSISKRAVTKTIYKDENYDVGGISNELSLHFDDETKALVGLSYITSKETTVWLDERFSSIQADIDKFFPNTVNKIMEWSKNLDAILFRQYSDANLGKTYIYFPNRRKMALISNFGEHLKDAELPTSKVITYKSKDGIVHEGYLTLPTAYDGSPAPTVVLVHGGPWARYHWGYDPDAQFFASRGYAVLRTNFRGSVGFGKEYLFAGIKSLATVMVDDVADGAKWLVDNNYADPNRLFIMGSSYGGYSALMSTIRHPSLYKAAVALASPLDLIEQINYYKKNDNEIAYEFWNVAVGDVKKEKKRLRSISPINNIDKFTVPYLIFHGKNDEVVPVEQAEAFKKKLDKKGFDNRVYLIQNEGHGFIKPSNNAYYVETAESFFREASDHSELQ